MAGGAAPASLVAAVTAAAFGSQVPGPIPGRRAGCLRPPARSSRPGGYPRPRSALTNATAIRYRRAEPCPQARAGPHLGQIQDGIDQHRAGARRHMPRRGVRRHPDGSACLSRSCHPGGGDRLLTIFDLNLPGGARVGHRCLQSNALPAPARAPDPASVPLAQPPAPIAFRCRRPSPCAARVLLARNDPARA